MNHPTGPATDADRAGKERTGHASLWKKFVLSAVALVVAVTGLSIGANLWLGKRSRLHPPPGRFYNVDNSRMHIVCMGHGSPTLILEAGLGDDWLQWRKVQPALAQVTRVCSYDRAGYGWSDPRSGTRDSIHIAEELHGLLQQAGIAGPIVLMGHSAGGLHIREYATRYPAGIVGLIFVDASTPQQFERLPRQLTAMDDLRWPKLETLLGIPRWRGLCGQHLWTGMGAVPSDSPQYRAWLQADDCSVSVLNTTQQEEDAFALSCREAGTTGPFGDMPILIFSEDPNYIPAFWLQFAPASLHAAFAASWNSLQEELKGLSTRSRRIIARNSSHYVQIDRPEVVIANVSQMIRTLQGEAPPPTYGTTTVE
ncbi:MAG TPA: alpha/beta hydrolase [Acidobacteriaceae bacterium]